MLLIYIYMYIYYIYMYEYTRYRPERQSERTRCSPSQEPDWVSSSGEYCSCGITIEGETGSVERKI